VFKSLFIKCTVYIYDDFFLIDNKVNNIIIVDNKISVDFILSNNFFFK
jgi:hypothetical protein